MLLWIGQHSLEVYLTHYLLLNLIRVENRPPFYSPQGGVLILVNYIVTVFLTILVITAMDKNIILKFVLVGKKK